MLACVNVCVNVVGVHFCVGAKNAKRALNRHRITHWIYTHTSMVAEFEFASKFSLDSFSSISSNQLSLSSFTTGIESASAEPAAVEFTADEGEVNCRIDVDVDRVSWLGVEEGILSKQMYKWWVVGVGKSTFYFKSV